MPRPRIRRQVSRHPKAVFFKPQGIPLNALKGVALPVEGFEALRLADAEGWDHARAADTMGVSRPTFSRILSGARQTVAKALANGWAIRIEGGDYEITSDRAHAGRSLGGRRRGRGRNRVDR